MKNRLQIRYHIPESLPTRAQAMTYLKERFAIGRTNTNNTSLPAEPLVLLYNDTPVNVAQGITEAQRLATANVLLAIGRGGDGVNVFNNQDYFVIDFAKHEEDIIKLSEEIDGIQDLVAEVNTTIKSMQENIQKNRMDIDAIIAEIGVYGDECEKGTIYGYLHCAYDQIEDEANRAQDAEQDLRHALETESARAKSEEARIEGKLDSESVRAQQAESDLQSHIDTEEASRIAEDTANREAITAETQRALDAEAELRSNLIDEINRATSKDGELADAIHAEYERSFKAEGDLNKRVDEEIARATATEKALTDNLNAEIARATAAEKVLTDNLNAEIARAKSEETRIEAKLDAEITRATSKDAEIDAQILDTNTRLSEEITRATTRENDLQAQITLEKETRIEKDRILQDNINKNLEAINLEILNRSNADATLDTRITNEIKAEADARVSKDNELNTKIETLISQEQSTRKYEDEALDAKIAANAADIRKNKVSSSAQTIIVTGPTETGTNLEVNVDNKTIVVNETGKLSVASEALVQYDGENAISVSDVVGGVKTISLNINENDNILTNDDNGLLATLSLKWVKATVEGEKDEIQLIGKNDAVISRIDVAEFIKDGMLDSVKLDSTNPDSPVLVFTFNSAAGKEMLSVNVKDLVDIYYAGNGLSLTGTTFAINIDKDSESFLMVGPDGLKLAGVQTAINTAVDTLNTKVDTETSKINTALDTLSGALSAEANARLSADNKLETDFKAADADIIKNYQSADAQLKTDFQSADAEIRSDFEKADAGIRHDFAAEDLLIRTEFNDADSLIRADFVAADAELKSTLAAADADIIKKYEAADADIIKNYKEADATLRTDFEKADTEIVKKYEAADATLRTDFEKADAEIIKNYKEADTALHTLLTDETARLAQEVKDALTEAKAYTDDEKERAVRVEATLQTAIQTEESRAKLAEQELLNKATTNADAISVLDKALEASRKDLSGKIDANVTTIGTIETRIGAEESRAQLAEQGLSNKIDANVATISTLTDNLNAEIARAKSEEVRIEGKLDVLDGTVKQLDKDLDAEVSRAKLAEQELSNKVDTNASAIAILTGDVTVDGSVKDVIFDSVLGSIVNTITLEDATEQSLIKKFTIDGVPYVYTSNSSVDMKHNGNALNVVLDGLRADVDSNANSTLELQTTVATISGKVDEHTVSIATLSGSVDTNKNDISNIKEDIKDIEADVEQLESEISKTINTLLAPMQATIATLQGEIATLRAELSAAQAKITTLETNAITTIQGTTNEIAVDRVGNTATIKFAEDAYFVAGV